MKALVVTKNYSMELRDIEMPKPGPYEALVKILACGICSSTDSNIAKGKLYFHKQYPCILGHESVGEVIEVGEKVTSFKKGDWVTRAYAIFPDGNSNGLYSGWGGMAEYGLVRDAKAIEDNGGPAMSADYTGLRQRKFPEKMRDIKSAVLSISLAETASWFWHAPNVSGKKVGVGGTGIAGLSLMIWAKMAGAEKVIALGRRDERLKLACEIAADEGVLSQSKDPSTEIKEVAGGHLSLFCEAVGSEEVFNIGLSCTAGGGEVALYGVPKGSYDFSTAQLGICSKLTKYPTEEHLAHDWVMDIIKRKLINSEKLMTHAWQLSEFDKAFSEISKGEVIKGMFII